MSGNRPSKHVHTLVKETATAMAHELYDTMMQDNVWYETWKKSNEGAGSKVLEELFVAKNLGLLVPQARAVLAGMLRTCQDEVQANEIYEALILDNTLIKGRK